MVTTRRWTRSRGVSLVEGAFLIPMMLMMIFGSIEFGTVLHMRHTMSTAAREAARTLAVQGGSIGDAEDAALALLPHSDNFHFEINATAPGPDDPDRSVVVEITLPAEDASLGNMFGFFDDDDALTVRVTMRSED